MTLIMSTVRTDIPSHAISMAVRIEFQCAGGSVDGDEPHLWGRAARDGLRATLNTTPSPGTASGIPGGLAAESYPVKVSDQLHDALTPDQVAAYDHNTANRTRSGRRRRNPDKEAERDQ